MSLNWQSGGKLMLQIKKKQKQKDYIIYAKSNKKIQI